MKIEIVNRSILFQDNMKNPWNRERPEARSCMKWMNSAQI